MNEQISEIFHQAADSLQAKGEGFRSHALRRAANLMANLQQDIMEFSDKRILGIAGFGPGILRRIREFQKTGTLADISKEIKKKRGKGGKRGGRGRERGKFPRNEIGSIGRKFIKEICGHHPASAYITGSYRRKAQRCGDCDLLVIYDGDPTDIANSFRESVKQQKGILLSEAKAGRVKVAARIGQIKVDLRVFKFEESGAGLLYFTGSQQFNIKCRMAAKSLGLKLNEYGLWDRTTNARIEVYTEDDILEKIGVGLVPPEERY